MQTQGTARAHYNRAWRWHFYAGLVVVPFLLVLALSGLVMVYYSSLATPSGPALAVQPAPAARRPA